MATFEGSVQEFHHYIGPRIRNRIQYLARKERKARNGVCADCGKSGQKLHSAHSREEAGERLLKQCWLVTRAMALFVVISGSPNLKLEPNMEMSGMLSN